MKRLLSFCLAVLLFFGGLQGEAMAARLPSYKYILIKDNVLGLSIVGITSCWNPLSEYILKPGESFQSPDIRFSRTTDRDFTVSIDERVVPDFGITSMKSLKLRFRNEGAVVTAENLPVSGNSTDPTTSSIYPARIENNPKDWFVIEVSAELLTNAGAKPILDEDGQPVIALQCAQEYPSLTDAPKPKFIPQVFSVPA